MNRRRREEDSLPGEGDSSSSGESGGGGSVGSETCLVSRADLRDASANRRQIAGTDTHSPHKSLIQLLRCTTLTKLLSSERKEDVRREMRKIFGKKTMS